MQKYGKMVLLLALCTAYYLGVELVVNDLALPLVGAHRVTALYGAGACAVALGFPGYWLVVRCIRRTAVKKVVTRAMLALCIVALACVYLVRQPAVFSLCALVLAYASGYMTALVFRIAAAFLAGSAHTGRVVGVAYGLAFVIQGAAIALAYAVPPPLDTYLEGLLLEGLLLLSYYVLLCQYPQAALYGAWDGPPLAGRAGRGPPPVRREIGTLLASVALICLLTGLNDGILTGLHAENRLVVYGGARLFSVPGLLLAGWVADRPGKKALPCATFAAMLGMTLAVLLFFGPQNYDAGMGLVYFFGAFMSVYCIVPFLRLAPATTAPPLVASIGRSAKYLFNGLAAVLGGWLYGRASLVTFAGIYIAILTLLFCLLFLAAPGESVPPAPPPATDPPPDLRSLYGLTARETEVLALVLEGKNTKEMAEALFITERTVKFHMSGILQKTGTTNRVELLLALRK